MAKFAPRQAGMSKLVLILIVLVAVFLGSGLTLGLYFAGVFDRADAQAEVAAEGEEGASVAKPEPPKPPIYVPIEPPLVVNFDRNGRMGFLQASIQLMTRDPEVETSVTQHLPVIRNDLLLLLGSKRYSDVATREGKEALRQEALDTINAILEGSGVAGRVENLYFTGFVMQ